jgi:hypothetical protein
MQVLSKPIRRLGATLAATTPVRVDQARNSSIATGRSDGLWRNGFKLLVNIAPRIE